MTLGVECRKITVGHGLGRTRGARRERPSGQNVPFRYMSALRNPWPAAGWLAITLLLLPGCGGGDRAAPDPLELAIAKPETLSGDQQVGVAGAELELALRVVVTRDSLPAAGVPVVWRTFEGSLTPASPVSDANGISTARWRLQRLFAQQVAGASLDFTGAPGVTFTAIATPDP